VQISEVPNGPITATNAQTRMPFGANSTKDHFSVADTMNTTAAKNFLGNTGSAVIATPTNVQPGGHIL